MSLNKGVNLIEGPSASPISGLTTQVSAFIGNFQRGPVNEKVLCGNVAKFQAIFGTENATGTTSYDSVLGAFYQAGNMPLYILRIAHSTAAKSAITIKDRNAPLVDTLKIEAKSEGIWGDNIQIEIKDDTYVSTLLAENMDAGVESAVLKSVAGLQIGSLVKFYNGATSDIVTLTGVNAGTKTISWSGVTTNAYTTANGVVTSLEFEIIVYYKGTQVEDHENLAMNDDHGRFCETVINHETTGSQYIIVTDLKSADTDELDLPALTAKSSLTGGADGLADVVKDDYVGTQASPKTGKYALDGIPNLFRVCCPNPKLTDEVPETAYKELALDLIAYCETRQISFLADIPYGKTPTTAITFRSGIESRFASIWYPWVKFNGTYIPPSSLVMGAAARKDAARGVHKNIGNENLLGVSALEYDLSRAEDESLNNALVDTIRKFADRGIVTFGGRTLSNVSTWRFINISEQWNKYARDITDGLSRFTFEPDSPETLKAMERAVDVYMAGEQRKGAIGGYTVDFLTLTTDQDRATGIARGGITYIAFNPAVFSESGLTVE
jgi:phage tail sheath protein FI